jgi:hypothetical protein
MVDMKNMLASAAKTILLTLLSPWIAKPV